VLWFQAPQHKQEVQWRAGLIFAALFVLANAGGIILTKVGVENAPALEATFFRTAWAVAGLAFWGLITRDLLRWYIPLRNGRLLVLLLFAGFVGAFLGTWLSVIALKLTHASVAAALNSTSPLFVLPLALLMLKERITFQGVIGATVAVGGIGLYFWTINLN
jgi:drug/metabolite transporter (DMT)-like permease